MLLTHLPSARFEISGDVCISRKIGQECVTNLALRVPSIHGVYRLRQFRTALLVDATCIDPSIANLCFSRNITRLLDLSVTFFRLVYAFLVVLISNLALTPGVGENGISGYIFTEKFLEGTRLRIDESHVRLPRSSLEGCRTVRIQDGVA